jgi:hypothetical protein
MVTKIQNFDKAYGQLIYGENGMVYTIEKANITGRAEMSEILAFFTVELFNVNMFDKATHRDFSIGIFADSKANVNIATVYPRGQLFPLYKDTGMSPVHFKNMQYFKSYVETLINRVMQ